MPKYVRPTYYILDYDMYTHFLTTLVINGQMRSWFVVSSLPHLLFRLT